MSLQKFKGLLNHVLENHQTLDIGRGSRGGSRTAATSKMERFVIIVNGWMPFIYDYLSNRKQRVKINETFSSWKDIEFGVPQESILGPLLFNIHLCDLFYFLEDLDIAS